MTPADLQSLALLLTALIAALNLFLIPLAKSAMRGEAAEMFNEHDANAQAHPAITFAGKEAIAEAAHRADEASASAARTERALVELREEVRRRLDALSAQIQETHDAFIEHDMWERSRYANTPPPPLRQKKR